MYWRYLKVFECSWRWFLPTIQWFFRKYLYVAQEEWISIPLHVPDLCMYAGWLDSRWSKQNSKFRACSRSREGRQGDHQQIIAPELTAANCHHLHWLCLVMISLLNMPWRVWEIWNRLVDLLSGSFSVEILAGNKEWVIGSWLMLYCIPCK